MLRVTVRSISACVSCPETPFGRRASSAMYGSLIVAEIPVIVGCSLRRMRRLRHRLICTPRFELNKSCHSSTTIDSSVEKRSIDFGEDKITDNDSGVVISMCGGFLNKLALSFAEVSPFLARILTSLPSKGSFKANSRSFVIARSGVT